VYWFDTEMQRKGCEEKHSHTAAHHPVVKPPAVVSTAVSLTPTQQQGWEKLLGTMLEPIERCVYIGVAVYLRDQLHLVAVGKSGVANAALSQTHVSIYMEYIQMYVHTDVCRWVCVSVVHRYGDCTCETSSIS